MNVDIEFEGNITLEDSYELQKLADDLVDDLQERVSLKKSPPERGVRDGGLVIGIAIATLAVSSIGTLFTVLSYWSATRPTYTVTLSSGRTKVTFGNLGPNGIQEIIRNFRASPNVSDMKVGISRNDLKHESKTA